jgi:hypothetical protein
MKRLIAALFLIIAAFSFPCAEEAFAGAWTVPQYHVWSEYYMKWDYAKRYYDPSGTQRRLSNDGRNWEFVQEPKMEYGVTDYLTALGSLEFKEAHYKEYDRPADWGPFVRKNHALTNVKLGARLRIIEKPVVCSIQGKFFIYPGYGIYHGDDPAYQHQPGIGHGDDAFELRVLMGKTFDMPFTRKFKLPCYWGAETGYRWRKSPVASDIPYFFECGFWPVKWFLVKTEIDGYKCNPGTGSIKESYGIWRIGGAWQVFGDSVLRRGDKMFNLEFQYGMTVWGKNTNAYQEWVLKVQTQF